MQRQQQTPSGFGCCFAGAAAAGRASKAACPIQNPKSKIQNTAGRVVVIGASNTDLVVHVPRLPQAGESVLGGDLLTFAGGKGANQAVAAARAGAKAYFIGAFGDDAFGRARRADLEKEGVDCSGCVVKKGVPSGVALIAIGEGKGKAKAENLIFVAPGANRSLRPEDVSKAMPKNLSIDDVVLCSLEVPLPAVMQALHMANSVAATVILNPAPFPPEGLPDELLKRCNMVVPNEVETEALFHAPPRTPEARARMLEFIQRLCHHIILTRGAKGAVYYYQSGISKLGAKTIPAPQVKPLDTVGAGDCFNGCLAAHLADNWFGIEGAIEGAIRFAVAAAALKVTRHGAQAGMPHRAEILGMARRAHMGK